MHVLSVAISAPGHARLGSVLSYTCDQALLRGTLVRVPLGRREVLGVVWADASNPDAAASNSDAGALKPVSAVLPGIAPMPKAWCELVDFSARYYQRPVGEVAVAALPPQLRDLTTVQLARRSHRSSVTAPGAPIVQPHAVDLSPSQVQVLAQLANERRPTLLFGATGSGKTEVYLQRVAQALATHEHAKVLVLVPEINLTPQLQQRFLERFSASLGPMGVVALHSGLTPAQRLKAWLAAHQGGARVVLGTRLAVLASVPGLALIVVDEEHDPSYKAQDGMRYSARDLAIWRGKNEGIDVLLGSATPSLESWQASSDTVLADAQTTPGRYARLCMPERIGNGLLPRLQLVDMTKQPKGSLLAPELIAAIAQRAALGEQCLVLLNRRGYASLLHCADCDWKSECPHCSAFRVFHKQDRSLRCHHCGFTERVPKACPSCGSLDLQMLGKGTEQLEEQLEALLTGVQTAHGKALTVSRIDADSTRKKGSLEQQLAAMHAGVIDVLVGTQMLAKGHDFRRITLVAAVAMDTALFSADYRAPERLFSLLMQVAGRAGRDAALSERSEFWLQTHAPKHSLFKHLLAQDFEGFAANQLREREQAGLPPFAFHALLRCESREQAVAVNFLQRAAHQARQSAASAHVTVYPPVPSYPQRVANIERAQMLIESNSRTALQRVLADLKLPDLNPSKGPDRVIRWAVDVDPLSI